MEVLYASLYRRANNFVAICRSELHLDSYSVHGRSYIVRQRKINLSVKFLFRRPRSASFRPASEPIAASTRASVLAVRSPKSYYPACRLPDTSGSLRFTELKYSQTEMDSTGRSLISFGSRWGTGANSRSRESLYF